MNIQQRKDLIEHIADIQQHTAPVTVVIGKDSVLLRKAPHTIVEAVMLWVRPPLTQDRKGPIVTVSATPKGMLIY